MQLALNLTGLHFSAKLDDDQVRGEVGKVTYYLSHDPTSGPSLTNLSAFFGCI